MMSDCKRFAFLSCAFLLVAGTIQGCAAVSAVGSVAGATVGIAATAAETTVDVGAAVITAPVDAVTDSKDPDEKEPDE